MNILYYCFICQIHVILGVRIRSLIVPSVVRFGEKSVVLQCDYDYAVYEKGQLDIKWYFNDNPTPFFQWVPGQMSRPQIIGELFRRHLDPLFASNELFRITDPFKRYRALYIRQPTSELSGKYTCKVSTFEDEDVRHKSMLIFSPPSSLTFEQNNLVKGDKNGINLTCMACGVFPQPKIKLTHGSFELDDSEANVIYWNVSGKYDITVHRIVDNVEHENITKWTFGCVLSIPGTDYKITETSADHVYNGANSVVSKEYVENGIMWMVNDWNKQLILNLFVLFVKKFHTNLSLES